MDEKQIIDEVELLELKADELVLLLRKGVRNDVRVRAMRQKLISAMDEASALHSKTGNAGNEIVNDDLASLFAKHPIGNGKNKFSLAENFKKGLLVIIGIIMITLGMAMIIMPAPPYFEMFTIFHFNPNDGVTIMDVLSLLIVFAGVYLFVNTAFVELRTSHLPVR
ncbi:MAG: hypothetical protein EOP55_24625 [Sphingobacteriales bacterium]|nr:MAG: hypothetical protein EOP55_24625 [Sphingobacteriales bacterium]